MSSLILEKLPLPTTPCFVKFTSDNFDSSQWINETHKQTTNAIDFWGAPLNTMFHKTEILVYAMQIIRMLRFAKLYNDSELKDWAANMKLNYDAAWKKENERDNSKYYKLDRSCALFADADNILNIILDTNLVI